MLAAIVGVVIIIYIILAVRYPWIALITSPLVTVIFFAFSLYMEDISSTCLSPLVFPATIITLVFAELPERRRWPHKTAKIILQVTGALLLLAIAIPLWPLALVLSPIYVTIILRYMLIAHNSTALYVMSTVGASMRQNLPLAMALDAAAGVGTDKRSRILRSIAKWLARGLTLSESVKQGYKRCPAEAIAMITAAEKIGQLPQAVLSIEETMAQKGAESRRIKPADMSYPFIVLSCALIVVMGLAIFIIPVFAKMLSDMTNGKVGLPAPTQFILDASALLLWDNGITIVLLGLVASILLCTAVFLHFRPRRPQDPYLLSKLGDMIKWHVPFLRWFEKNYALLQVVSLLKVSLNTGCPVNEAIRNTTDLDTNCCFRRRLGRWLSKVEAGENISAAAQDSSMPKTIVWTFDDSVNKGNTPAILEMLEDFYRGTYNFRINIAKSVMAPIMVVSLAVVIGFIVYALFAPMISMLNILSADVMP